MKMEWNSGPPRNYQESTMNSISPTHSMTWRCPSIGGVGNLIETRFIFTKNTLLQNHKERIFLQAQTTYIYPLGLLPHNHPTRARLLFFSKNIRPSKRKNPKQQHELKPSGKPRKRDDHRRFAITIMSPTSISSPLF